MTFLRLLAIATIFFCTTIGWFILGVTVHERTDESDGRLGGEVERLWGGHHTQMAPSAHYETQKNVVHDVNGATVTETVTDRTYVPLTSSRIDVALELDQRRKGLLWYNTYAVAFTAHYTVANPDREPRKVFVHLTFPSRDAIYDAFQFRVNGQATASAVNDLNAGITSSVELAPGASVPIDVVYRTRGLDDWHYAFGEGVSQIADFELVAHTDTTGIDYPAGSMSPTTHATTGDGMQLSWKFTSLVTGHDIAIAMPARMNPGPLAARIAFFAPVGLLFFFTVMVILGILRGRSLHPMNYFFLSAGFFAFHLLLSYLVDHVDIHAAFGISTAVSVALVISYLRLVAGRAFVVVEAAIAQVVFLVMFSYAFFFEGYTGLTVTAGAILTLFVLMQVTGRVDWATVFERKKP